MNLCACRELDGGGGAPRQCEEVQQRYEEEGRSY